MRGKAQEFPLTLTLSPEVHGGEGTGGCPAYFFFAAAMRMRRALSLIKPSASF